MTYEQMARANYWEVTLNHNDTYVAHDVHPNVNDEPVYYLDAETEGEAWQELCELEGITQEGFGS